MRSSPSTTKRRSLMRRLRFSASAVRTRSSSSSSAIRIVMERRAVGASGGYTGDLILGLGVGIGSGNSDVGDGPSSGWCHREADGERGAVIELAYRR